MPWSANTVILLVATICCTSAAQVFQKRAAMDLVSRQSQPQQKIAGLLSADVLISILLLGCGLLLWLIVLSKVQVSIAYPLLSINYVIVLLCAKWLFNETIPTHRWIGAFSIMAGIWLLVGEAAQ